MSAPPYAEARQPMEVPVRSTALVPVIGDGRMRQVPAAPQEPANVHRFFFGLGYAGLPLIWAGAVAGSVAGDGYAVLAGFGAIFVGLGGVGVVIHTLWKPNERKVRHLLLALASLALTLLSLVPARPMAREMYATAAVTRLEPLAATLANDARIRHIGVSFNQNVMLNGYFGSGFGMGRVNGKDGEHTLESVLERDGITRAEFDAYQRRLREAGMKEAHRTASTVAFGPSGAGGMMLVYVLPGHALPPAHALVGDRGYWRSRPLGGSWYMALAGRR